MGQNRQWDKRAGLGLIGLVVIGLVAAAGCGGNGSGSDGDGTPAAPTRSFAMGFTPWPYAATLQAVGDTYAKVHAHGDLITHHLDSGVPWPEAYADAPPYNAGYNANVEGELDQRLANTDALMPVLLAVCPLNTQRNAPADYWGSSANMPRPSPWDSYDFGDQELADAYVNYLLNLIDRFAPAYCNYGIEATEYIRNHPTRANDLFGFLQAVYTAVKQVHPNLPLFISVTLQAPGSSDALLVQGYAAQIAACSDILGVSSYGYIFYGHADSGNPANLPADWLSQAQAYAPGLPLAIAESGWIAEDLVISSYSVNISGTADWQADYVQKLLAEADRLNALFVTWFAMVDFDTLWNDTLGQDPLARIWRDTGLYNETGQTRPSLAVWDAWLARQTR